jgi:3-isopropylmalate/(R)-2-methylmalate dehydratase large subunit
VNSLPRTLFDKVWDRHVVVSETADSPAVLYVDLHLVHEVTSPQAFDVLRARGLRLRRPDRTLATMDHSTPTDPAQVAGRVPIAVESAARQVRQLTRNCQEFGLELLGMEDDRRGIVHIIGPELGLTQPGRTIVCGDSHTSTHGAFGALAFGIGTTEVGHVFATQCLLQRRPRTMAVDVTGRLGPGITAKDLVLAIIGRVGVNGGTGHVIEYLGSGVEALSMDERMTVCNMSIEAGARAGMVAPDDTTFEYLRGRPRAPAGDSWERAVADWRTLRTDPDAAFDRRVSHAADVVEPMITYGTHPGMVVPLGGCVPDRPGDAVHAKSLAYMGLQPGERLRDKAIQAVFIGSCTNARLSDLELAAKVFAGRRVAPGVRVLIVPGSQSVKREAEARGIAQIFLDAGAEWRESGCSMCLGMNGDTVEPGQYCVSTSNRNFEGRQGKGARTLLASPAAAAAAAVRGCITDPREFLH